MKIVCGSCQAKYSIADEKVAGKVFRIRCKRCGEVIVVRGDHDSPEAGVTVAANGNGQGAQPQAAAEAPSDAIWHVVINGEQAGPYSPAQLGELVASGQLDWEAYVWSEGFENWLPMRDVPDLVSAISGGQGTPVAMGKPAAAAANTQMGADPFPEEAPAQQQVVYAKAAGGGGGGVVQSSSRSEAPAQALGSFDIGGSSSGAVQSPRVSAQQAMTGSRNENSVLFSLKNLQALATGSVPPPSSNSVSVRPGHAAGEGSGLIDIRALATTTGVEHTKNSEKDALLALGSAQAGAFGALGSPMLAPPGKVEEESGKKPLVLAIVGGCALLAVAVVAVAFIMRGGSATPAEVAPIAPAMPGAVATAPGTPAPQPSAAAAPTPAAPQPTEALSEGELAARAAAAAAAKSNEPAAAATSSAKPSAAPARHGGPSATSSEKAPEPAAAATPAAKPAEAAPAPRKSNSIDDLLNDAIGGKSNAIGAKPAAAANLPEKPSRDDVLQAMKAVTDKVKACGGGQTGVAFANMTVIGKTGRVGNVEVTGITGEPGSCIAKAVRGAVFPKFSAENFQVKFPFRL
jgi:predicted Zn finger-like uncharacterized protein